MDLKNRCCVCDKIFTSNGSVKRHLKEVHGVRKPVNNNPNHKWLPCEYCNKTFFDTNALNKHVRSVHKSEKTPQKSTTDLNPITNNGLVNKCLDCSIEFASIKDLLLHLTIMHNFIEECLEENFSNLEEFYMWLSHIEEENKLKYIRKRGTCIDKSYSRLYYECNRSGMKPETIMNRKRCQKFQGSQKIGFRCTSHLVVKVDKNTNAVHVKYWKTHYGHDIQIQHIRIPESAKKNIAAKLALGISVPKIIDSIRDGIGDSYQTLRRVDIITRKDIHNIKRSFKIDIMDGIRHTDDALNSSFDLKQDEDDEGYTKWSLFDNKNKKMYTITKRTSDQCCALACQNCKICYHSFSCTCIDYCIKSNICKHIHFTCIQTKKNYNSASVNKHVTSQEDIELCLNGIKKIDGNKQYIKEKIISTALEVVTLASKPVSTEILSSAYKQLNATKSLLQIAEIPNRNDFTFFSTKRKKLHKNDTERLRKPTLDERSDLELALSNQLEISKSSSNDHTYAHFKL